MTSEALGNFYPKREALAGKERFDADARNDDASDVGDVTDQPWPEQRVISGGHQPVYGYPNSG